MSERQPVTSNSAATMADTAGSGISVSRESSLVGAADRMGGLG